MYGAPRPLIPNNTHWNYHRHPQNPQWRHPGGPRAPFRGQHQRFSHHRPPFQPGNDNYWCETCDRGFPSEDILSKHLQQHEKCNIDGCQFVAHPKVITKHIQMQHSSGLYKKIANINRPEEIERWREERRKKYPTKSNIDKKVAEMKERIDRGEKMGLDRNRNRHNNDDSGHNKDYSRHNKDNRPGQDLKRRNNMGNENQPKSKRRDTNHIKKPPPPAKALPVVEDNRKLKPFDGILSLHMDSDSEIEDTKEPTMINLIEDDDCEESKSSETKPVETSKPVVCGALSSLMCDYGSSDEEDNNKDKVCIVNTKQEPPESVQKSNIDVKKIKEASENLQKTSEDRKKYKDIQQESPENVQDGEICQNGQQKDVQVIETATHSDVLEVVNNCETEIKNENIVEVCTFHTQKRGEDDIDSGPEEVKVVKQGETISTQPVSSKPKDIVSRKNTVKEKKPVYNRPKSKLPSTLLQKLLSKEIQQERNIVLQCIRYIRRSNYFDKEE